MGDEEVFTAEALGVATEDPSRAGRQFIGRYIAVESLAYRVPGDWTTYKRDLWIGKLDQTAWPPTVDYWTNVSDAPGGESMSGYWLSRFQNVFPNPNNPVLVMSGPGTNKPENFVVF